MKSIREKVTILTTFAILMVAVATGVMAVYNIRQVGNYDSAQILNLTSEKESANIDRRLHSTEEAVQILADYALERLFSAEKLATDDAYRDSYTVQVGNLFGNIATNVPGTLAYYVRYNPEIIPLDSGLYYRREESSGEFISESPENIYAFGIDSSGNVTWWDETINDKNPRWIEPYHNKAIDKYLISYIIPLYENDILIGIAGMDINYYEIAEDVKAVKCYETGYACLADTNGDVFYNPNYEDGTAMNQMQLAGTLSFEADSSGDTPITYYLGSVEKQMAYRTLSNGMRLIITAPISEINAMSNQLVRQIFISTVIVLMTFFFLTIMVSRRITGPLKELSDVARQINEGRLEVTFPAETKDEVGELTHAMEKMVHHLKHHIDGLNSLAYHDSLTGVKNKTAYDDAAAKLDNLEGEKEFGIVVLDANNLKKINDTYGHERGNVYLRNACKLTCRIFKGSPVYRIGGDEFVVILQGDDYDNCYKLMRDFDIEAEKHNLATDNEWERINIAKGMVKYDPDTDNDVESVFKRADARMYVAKQKMKLAEMSY